METINEKCCEVVQKESCCDKAAPVNVYINSGKCCCGSDDNGGGNGAYDHDKLENRNLGIQHDASAIGFADGETFQEKYDKGELTGPQGEKGDISPKGDSDSLDNLPWCSGHFDKNTSLVASTVTVLTPIVDEGDATMVSGTDFIIPDDGCYSLSFCRAQLPSYGNNRTFISLKPSIDAGSHTANSAELPGNSYVGRANAGDIWQAKVSSSVAQSTLGIKPDIMRFDFIRLR